MRIYFVLLILKFTLSNLLASDYVQFLHLNACMAFVLMGIRGILTIIRCFKYVNFLYIRYRKNRLLIFNHEIISKCVYVPLQKLEFFSNETSVLDNWTPITLWTFNFGTFISYITSLQIKSHIVRGELVIIHKSLSVSEISNIRFCVKQRDTET